MWKTDPNHAIQTAMVELESVRAFQPSDPVESIDYDTNASRLAVGSQHGNVSIYEVGKHGVEISISFLKCFNSISNIGTMLRLWTVSVGLDHSPVIARSLAFSDFGGKILIFVLETGEMCVLLCYYHVIVLRFFIGYVMMWFPVKKIGVKS